MKRRRVIVISAVCVVVLVLAAVVWPGEREPEYEGKKLSEWLILERTSRTAQEHQIAANAICRIGTNGLPLLIKRINWSVPRWRLNLALMAERLPKWTGVSSRLSGVTIPRGPSDALIGFQILGPIAEPGVPELVKLLTTRPDVQLCDYALVAIGEKAVPGLALALEDPKIENRAEVADCLGLMQLKGIDIDAAVPALVRSSTENSSRLGVTSKKVLDSVAPPVRQRNGTQGKEN